MSTFSRFWNDQSAATAIEYALIASFIAMAILASINGLGSAINSVFNTLRGALN